MARPQEQEWSSPCFSVGGGSVCAQLLLDTWKCWGFAGAVTQGSLARTPRSG